MTALAALLATHLPAAANDYPTKPVRILVGYTPGGVNDVIARLIGQSLTERLGQSFVVENRAGAGSNIATEAVVRAPADGYTLLLAGTTNVINTALYDNLSFDFARDIVGVATIARVPYVLVVNPKVAAKDIPEFIALAKASPGKVAIASAGIGSPPHLAMELFRMLTGVDVLHVPYQGAAPAISDVLAGHVDGYFASTASSIEYIKAHQLKALGVTSTGSADVLPGVVPIAASAPGYEAVSWYGLTARQGTPQAIIDVLHREVGAALADAKVRARLAELGGTPLAASQAEFSRLIAEDSEKWAKVVKFAGAKVK